MKSLTIPAKKHKYQKMHLHFAFPFFQSLRLLHYPLLSLFWLIAPDLYANDTLKGPFEKNEPENSLKQPSFKGDLNPQNQIATMNNQESAFHQSNPRKWSLCFGNRFLFNNDHSVSIGNYISFGWKCMPHFEAGLGLGYYDLDLTPDARIYPAYIYTSWNPGRFKFRPVFNVGLGTQLVKAPENFYFWGSAESIIENGHYGHVEAGMSYNFSKGERLKILVGLQYNQFKIKYILNDTSSESYKNKLIKFYLSMSLSI